MSEDTRSQLFRSFFEYGRDALKAAMIINGAALIALLAFVGNIWSDDLDQRTAKYLSGSILSFCIGLLVSVFSIVLNYLSIFAQHSFTIEKEEKRLIGSENINFHKEKLLRNFHFYLTIFLIAASIGLFSAGIFGVYKAISSHLFAE